MKAIILAGGKGTRLQTVIKDVPKPMALIAGKPFLEYLILQLKAWHIKDIILSIGYKKEIIKSYFSTGSKCDVNITYIEEDIPLGTGGAIREAIKSIDEDNVFVLNGDSFVDADFSAINEFHHNNKALVTMALIKIENSSRYGRVCVDDNGRVTSFVEKTAGCNCGSIINAGLYVLNTSIIKYISEGVVSFETDVLPNLVGKELYGNLQTGFFIDIGIPDDYKYLCNNPGELYIG